METVDRRTVLRSFLSLSGAAVATAAVATMGVTMMPAPLEAVPLAMDKNLAGAADDLVEEAQVVVVGPRRGRGRRRCWWRRGRRVCAWR
jgi:hypothetical protein